MKAWRRFALPLGSAFVVAVLLDNIISFDWLLKEFFLFVYPDSNFFIDFYDREDFPLVLVILRAILAPLLWIALFTGPNRMLFFWIIISVIVDSLRHGNLKLIYNSILELDLYLFLIMPTLRIYIVFVIIEVAQILEKRRGNDENLDEEEIEMLKPIGTGMNKVLKYYMDYGDLAANTLLIIDGLWNLILLPTMKASLGGFGGFIFTCFGATMDAIGIEFIAKRRPTLMVIWKIVYAHALFVQFLIFSDYFGDLIKHPSALEFISCFTFAAMLVLRGIVLFFCIKCTLHPIPPSSPTPIPEVTTEETLIQINQPEDEAPKIECIFATMNVVSDIESGQKTPN